MSTHTKDYFAFYVEGTPKPQPRPRCMGRGGKVWAFNDESTALKVWKFAVKHHAQKLGFKYAATDRVGVQIVLHVNGRRGDLDNLAKAMLDAMTNAGLWRDDAQVDKLEISRRKPDSEREGADVFVWRIITDEEEALEDDNRVSMKDVERLTVRGGVFKDAKA